MKTQVIVSKGWILVKEYDFVITMAKGDVVQVDGIEYRVKALCLNIDKNQLEIIIELS